MTNNELIGLKRKYKKIERITLAIDLILLFVYFVLSFVYQSVNFNSVVYFVLVVITGVIMIADLVMLVISWYKLYRIDSAIARQEEDASENDNDE